jgi:hypothetical protein
VHPSTFFFFRVRFIFASFSARHSLATRILLLHSLLISFPYHVRLPAAAVILLAPRGPFPFHFGLDTIPLVVALCDPAPLG